MALAEICFCACVSGLCVVVGLPMSTSPLTSLNSFSSFSLARLSLLWMAVDLEECVNRPKTVAPTLISNHATLA